MATAISTSEGETVQIKDVLTCVICKQDNSSPLLQLNCFHVCHKNCLKKSLRNARPGSKFNCDECKTTNVMPTNGVEGILEEVLQYKMKEIADIFSNSSPPCKICEEIGEENVSSNYCITCKMHLCQTDTKRHKLLPDHTIITNVETQTEQYLPRILSSKKALCSIHATEDSAKILEFYCQQCQIPTCQVCCITDHKLHKTISLQEASGKFKEELKSKAREIPNKHQCGIVVHKLEQILNDLEENSKVQIEKCQKWGDDVKKVIDKIVKENVQNIEKITLIQKNHIMKTTEEKKYQNKQFQSARDYTEVFLKFGSNSDFLQKHKLFIENLQKCLLQEVGVSFDTEEFKVELKDVKEVEKTVKEMVKNETVYRTHQVKGLLQLTGCTLELEWETDEEWVGLAVEGEVVIAVGGKRIEVYGMNGERKGQIKCQELGYADGIEVVKGQIFVSDSGENKRQILVIDRNGRVIRKLGLPVQENGLDHTTLGLAVDDSTEDIYIASSGTHTVYKCPTGQPVASPFITTGLNGPCDLCITSNHEVIVSNWSSHKVSKYSSEGTLLWEYRQYREGERQLNSPAGGVCADPSGNVFVCDYYNNRIHHVSSDGKFLSFIKVREEIEYPFAITWYNEKLFISSNGSPPKIIVIKCQYN